METRGEKMNQNWLNDLIEKGNDWISFIRYLNDKIEELDKRIEYLEKEAKK